MTAEEKLFELLAGKSRDLQRPLKKAEWLAVAGAFLKALAKERRSAAIAEGAEEIYAGYPKKVGKDEALKAITKALKNHPKEYLLDKTNQFRIAVEAWPQSYRYFQDGADRCPHPATWFNQGRFQDDPKEWRRAGARGARETNVFTAGPELTEEQKNEQAALVKKYQEMPEPEKGTFEHALWVEARVNATVAKVTDSATSVVKTIEHEQRLRDA